MSGGGKPAQWRTLEAAFEELVDLDEPGRAAGLAALRQRDAALADRVVELLAADARAETGLPGTPFAGAGPDEEDHDLAPGTQVGRYRIIRRVAAGGMGVVYEAEQEHPRRVVALKVIRPGRLAGSLRRRFELEGRILGRLQHPGIAAVHDAGTATVAGVPVPFLAMEFVDGIELRAAADEAGLDLRERIELLARVADAVQHAHQRGVIHRDLKPANVLVPRTSDPPPPASASGAAAALSAPAESAPSPDAPSTHRSPSSAGLPGHAGRVGQPKVLDFGVARLLFPEDEEARGGTLAGQVIGTVPYMSPEQLAGDHDAVDTRTDVHALGVIGFELLTGSLPHPTRDCTPAEASRRLAARPTPRPSSLDRAVRGDIEQVLLKAVARERDRRYDAAGDLAADLRRVLRREPVLARAPSAWYHLTTFARRHVAVAVAAALVLLVAAVAATAVSVALVRERAAAAREDLVRADLEQDRRTLRRTVDFLADEVLGRAAPGVGGPQMPIAEVLRLASSRVDEGWAEDPVIESEIRELLAGTWRAMGELDQAVLHAERSLELRREHLPADDEWVIAAHHNLAGILLDAGRPVEAVPHVEAAIDGLASRPDLRPRLVTVRSGHVSLLVDLGRLDDAIAQGEAAVALAAEVLPADHRSRLVAHQNLGHALRRAGRTEEAMPHAMLALEGYRRIDGPDQPSTVMQMDNVGGLLGELGRLEEAAVMLEETLATKRRLLGDEHPQTLMSVTSLGRLEIRRDRLEEAEALLQSAVDGWTRLRGDDDQQRLIALNALGMVLRARGDWAAAEPLHEDLRAAIERTLDPRHPGSIIVRTSLAEVWIERGRTADAAMLLTEVAGDAAEGLPASHDEWVRLERLRGRAAEHLGDLDAADAAYRRALVAVERLLEADDDKAVWLRAAIARVGTADE